MKHGKDVSTLVRSSENIKTKYEKVILGINFLKQCNNVS